MESLGPYPINAGEICALMKVTLRARKCQVAGVIRAAMLASSDMFNVKTETGKFL